MLWNYKLIVNCYGNSTRAQQYPDSLISASQSGDNRLIYLVLCDIIIKVKLFVLVLHNCMRSLI